MKRIAVLTALFGLMLASVAGAQVDKKVGKLGLGIDGGLMIPASGDVTTDSSFGDFFKIGPGFGAHVLFTPVKPVTIKGGFSYTFLKMKDEVRPAGEADPYFTSPYVYLDGVLNLGTFLKPTGRISPYVTAGAGIYMWKITDDGAGGDAVVLDNNEEFKKTSIGFHFGPGVEVFATPDLSFFAEGKYHIVLTKDEDKFGEEFKNMNALDVSAGLTYHFALGVK